MIRGSGGPALEPYYTVSRSMVVSESSKPLAFAVASWLQNQEDAKLKKAADSVCEACGFDTSSSADKDKYAKNSPGLQAIFDVFVKTQQKMNNTKDSRAVSDSGANVDTKHVSEEDSSKAESLKNDGNKYMSAKDYGAALDSYTKAIELNPYSPVFYSNRAAAYSQIGQHDEAIADARKAAEINPTFGKAYSRLGHALFASGQFAEAVKAYEKGVEVDPSNKLMKSGLEASKAKLSDSSSGNKDALATQAPSNGSNADPLAGAGTGTGAGAGGMPDLSTLMNNPMVAQMAQQMYVLTTCVLRANVTQDAKWRPRATNEQPYVAPDGGELWIQRSDARCSSNDEQPTTPSVRVRMKSMRAAS